MSERYSMAYDDVTSGNWFVSDANERNRAIAMCTREADAEGICAAKNAADALAPPDSSPEGETVNVRVAVAVAPDGRWEACGTERDKGEDSMGDVVDSLIVDVNDQLGLATYYLTATLAVPTTNEVPATVESQKE